MKQQHLGSSVTLAEVKELIRRQQYPKAEKRLRDLAARRPRDAEVIGMQGALAADRGKLKAGMELLAKSLSLDGSPAALRRNLSVFVAIAFAQGQHETAKQALNRAVPASDAGAALPPADLSIVISLANQLAAIGRHENSAELLNRFWTQIKDHPGALELLGRVKLAGGQPREALDTLKRASELTPSDPELLIAFGAAAVAADDIKTAETVAKDYVRRFPAYLSDRLPGQLMTIGVANWQQKLIKSPWLSEFHFGGNFITQIAKRHAATYRILSVLLNSQNALEAISSNPTPDIIYNSVVNPEVILRHGFLAKLATLIGIWDRPVINHPECVLKTSRLAAGSLYGDIDALVVPKVSEFDRGIDDGELTERIEAEFEYPIIARGLVEQEGKNVFFIADRTALNAALHHLKSERRFYVIQFHHSHHGEGYYRKIRAAVAGDFIQIVRVDHDVTWNVHGRKAEAKIHFYKENPRLLEQEAAICMDPDAHLGSQVMRTLRAIRARNPLDVFGIDFDVMPDGRLVFFEANAVMNLLSTGNPRIPYPKEPEALFMAAFVDFSKRLKASAGFRPT